MFDPEKYRDCPLESILLAAPITRRRHLQIVVDFMKSRPGTLWELGVGQSESESACSTHNESVRVISDAMNQGAARLNAGLRLRSLKFCARNQHIMDQDVYRLLWSINARYLEVFHVESKVLTQTACDYVARFLGREDTIIQDLSVKMGTHSIQTFLHHVPKNSTLRKVHLRQLSGDAPEKLLEDLVIDTSSFAELCSSNHTLSYVGESIDALKRKSAKI